jgi:hypothetical protein
MAVILALVAGDGRKAVRLLPAGPMRRRDRPRRIGQFSPLSACINEYRAFFSNG